jgi:hypothetical protein
MIRYGSFAEVTHGIVPWKKWIVNKVRRWVWGLVASTCFAIAMVTLLAIGQWKLSTWTSYGVAVVSTRALLVLAQLLLIAFVSTLLWGMHTGSQTVMPTFSYPVPRFEPRPPPDESKGETWEDWLRKGVRIGRWQGKVGSLEPGDIAWMQIVDVHPLIAAESRMGKSTLLWAILWELKPAIDAGVVEIILFDPKNGMEMAPAVKMGLVKCIERMGRPEGQVDEVNNFYYGADVGAPDPNNPERWIGKRYEETFVIPLEFHVQQMRARAAEVRGSMQWIPASKKYKRRIVIVDEGASLARPGSRPEVRQRIISAMLNLLDQGAGAGYTVITATQHPDMKKVPWRHGHIGAGLVGLVKTWDAVEMVLGKGAYAKGAYADQLSPRVKGVFFMSGHGAWQLRVQDAKPTFKRRPPDRGGGKEIEKYETDPEPSNEELNQSNVVPLHGRRDREAAQTGEQRQVGAA